MRGWAALAVRALGVLAAVAALAPSAAFALPAARAQERLPEVGSGPPGDVAFRLVGRAAVGPDAARLYGYLSGAIGLGAADLASGSGGAPGSARFTWVAELPAMERATRGDVTTFVGDGTLSIHPAPDGGAAWDDPSSFGADEPVAVYETSLTVAVQRQSPTLGVVVADGTLRQEEAQPFEIDGATFRFGRPGAAFRLRMTGALAGEAASGQSWPVDLLGTAILTDPGPVAGRAVSAPPVDPATGTPTSDAGGAPGSAGGACPDWAGATSERLLAAQARADDARAAIAAGTDVAAIDAAALATDADVAAQRAESPAAADAATQRLASAALGTYLRGLRAVADALSVGDGAAASGATATLTDADALAGRALEALAAAYPGCGEG